MRAALLSLVALVSAACAGPRAPTPVEVKPGGFAELTADATGGKMVLWTVSPDPIQDDEIGGVLVFTGEAGREYTATAIVIDFKAGAADKVRYKVKFLGAPAPPAPPVPPPTPDPPPVSPLAGAIKAAAAKDGLAPARLLDLAAAFAVCGDVKRDTAGDYRKAVNAVIVGALKAQPANLWPVVQSVTAGIDSVLSTDPDKPMADADRAAVKAIFAKLSDACREAAK